MTTTTTTTTADNNNNNNGPLYTSTAWLDSRIQAYPAWPLAAAVDPAAPPSYDAMFVWVKRRLPFQRVDGGLVPLAVESWITFTIVHLLLRWLHTTLVLLDALPTFALREFSNDVGWGFLHTAVLLFVFAFLHTTPILSSVDDDRYRLLRAVGRFQAQNPVFFRAAYFSNILLSFAPTVFATATGLAADRGDIASAVAILRAHYLVWVGEIVILMAYFVVCGFMLSMHIEDRAEAARIAGLDGPTVREITASTRSMQNMIVLENSLAFLFIVILAGYSFFRVTIHSTPFQQYMFTTGYFFSFPIGICVSYVVILKGPRVRRHGPDRVSHIARLPAVRRHGLPADAGDVGAAWDWALSSAREQHYQNPYHLQQYQHQQQQQEQRWFCWGWNDAGVGNGGECVKRRDFCGG
ncbi:hypothetical protein DFJ73DRAFT_960233 [Zopfochytrium polystomum]|nr:hypothetical protein DFJ73DRAFT_960233 [Zopfochytrium polystomum]